MAYECQNFKNGQVLTAECLNKIDEWLGYICGKEIVSGEVNGNGELILTLCNGDKMNVGEVGAIHVGEDEPTNGAKVWIDTDEEGVGTGVDVTAEVGQAIAVAAVDENGKAVEFKASDLPYTDKNGIVHKLNNKYIDADWMATSEDYTDVDTIIPEQKVSGTWSNLQYLLQPGIEYDVIINGVVYPCVAWGSGAVILGNNTSLSKNDYPFSVYWAGGTATMGMFFYDENVFSSPIYLEVTEHSWTEYNKLPEEFLPESVDGVIVRSCTEGSSKKFKITVDDSGTISATEVTE